MGLVLNPFAHRIGHTKSWSDSWYLVSTEYVEFLHSSIFLKSFIYYILYKFYPTRFSSLLLIHTEILFFNNVMYIWLYLYEASGRYKITKYIRKLKFGHFKGYKMRTFWLKKRIFDRNPIALGIFNFIKAFGPHLEKYPIVENYVFENKNRNKIAYLKKKYGPTWLGKEEVVIFRSVLGIFKNSVNPYSMRYLSIILNSLYLSPMHDYKLNEKKMKALRIFIFFVSYLLSLIRTWPYYRSKKLAFTSKIIFVLLRRTVYWLFFIPFIKQLSKFLEYLCSFFGVSSVVRASILTNFSLSAFFIARYIMTAIKNGFNYLDIVFPIRKTLNSFMALRVFDSFVNRKSKIKDSFVKVRFDSMNKRASLVIAFVLVIKYKLFMNNLLNYSYSYYNNMNFYNKFCTIKFSNSVKYYYKNIFNKYKARVSYVRKNYFLKRFYSNSYNKIRFFKFFENRLAAEIIEKLRREKRKPLTLSQKVQYNEKRRVKRIQIRFEIEMATRRRLYKEVFERFNDKLSNIRRFAYLSFNKKKIYNKKKYISNNRIIRAYSTKTSNFSIRSVLLKVINLYFFLFWVKFFKVIKFRFIVRFKKNKKRYFRKGKATLLQFFLKRRKLLKRIYLLILKRFERKLALTSTFYLYYLINYGLVPRRFFVRNFRYKKLSLDNTKFFIKKKSINKLVFKRMYHSSIGLKSKSGGVVELLKSLVALGDNRVVKNYRPKKKNIFNVTALKLKKGFIIKKLPSKVIKRKFDNEAIYKYKMFSFNINVNTIFSVFLIGNIHSTFNKLSTHVSYKFHSDFLISLILKVLKCYVYLLLIFSNFGANKMKKIIFYFFERIHISYIGLINILYNINSIPFNNLALNLYNKLVKIINLNLYSVKDYINYMLSYSKNGINDKYLYFNFINKFVDFAQKSVFILGSFRYYFLYLLKLISINFKEIYSFDHIYIKRLLKFIDIYWFFGLNNFKNVSKFNLFLKNFRIIITITYSVLKLLFNSVIENDYFYGFYNCFILFLPSFFSNQYMTINSHNKYNLLYNIYNSSINNISFFKHSRSFNSSFIHFKYFFDILNLVERSMLNLIVFKSINGLNVKFPLNIGDYLSYVKELFADSSRVFGIDVQFITNKLLSYGNKIVRVKSRDHIKSFLYGFKFHFVGRFTRKQQSASMWFRQGFLPSSSMDSEVDYGMFTIPLKFSACTVKVWLYRGVYVPKRTITYEKWL